MLRHSIPIKILSFPIFHLIFEALRIEWRNPTPRFASLTGRGNQNIKHFIPTSVNRTHNRQDCSHQETKSKQEAGVPPGRARGCCWPLVFILAVFLNIVKLCINIYMWYTKVIRYYVTNLNYTSVSHLVLYLLVIVSGSIIRKKKCLSLVR